MVKNDDLVRGAARRQTTVISARLFRGPMEQLDRAINDGDVLPEFNANDLRQIYSTTVLPTIATSSKRLHCVPEKSVHLFIF